MNNSKTKSKNPRKDLGQIPNNAPNRLPAKKEPLDVRQALRLRLTNHMTYQQIADQLECAKSSVHEALAPFVKILETPEAVAAYRNEKASIIDALEMLLLLDMADIEKRKKASINNLAFAADKLHQMGRLERNLSTANVSLADLSPREQERYRKIAADASRDIYQEARESIKNDLKNAEKSDSD